MRLLVFSAHTADFCSRSGGTIAKVVRAGGKVRAVLLSFGERSESGDLYRGAQPSLEEVKAIRRQEAREAAQILGAELKFLDWGDLSFGYSPERVKALAEEIRAFRPDAILTHHGPDPWSVDHDMTWQLVRRANQVASAPGFESERERVRRVPLFLFEATIPLGEMEGFNPDFYIDITEVWDVKRRALEAFRQAQSFLAEWYTHMARHRAFQARHLTGKAEIEYAEAFERTTPWVGQSLPLHEL